MSEAQPPPSTKAPTTPKSTPPRPPNPAEDRKAASALASLDADDASNSQSKLVDEDAVHNAIKSLGGAKPAAAPAAAPKKNVKVDAADVALLVDELDLSKIKATEMLKSHDGDAVGAMKAFIGV
ncbi:hypothetical protein G7046_g8827 [Stylonectria norvegica]|nr:hypothetical protein G7046_g8827 [Stylonectria norvegica]